MKSVYKITFLICITVLVSSCHNTSEPNYQYMPNMYEPVSYNTYSEAPVFKNGLKSPIDSLSTKDSEKAKELFEIYCAICHGNAGDGKGKLVTQGKFLGVPSYKDRPTITAGSIFHVQTYGLNSMGSYANQLSAHERWLVSAYVLKLQSEL